MKILVLNSGSSSVKFQIIETDLELTDLASTLIYISRSIGRPLFHILPSHARHFDGTIYVRTHAALFAFREP